MSQFNSNPSLSGGSNDASLSALQVPKVREIQWVQPGPAQPHPLTTLSSDLKLEYTAKRCVSSSFETWLSNAYEKALPKDSPLKVIGVGESSHGCAVQFETQAKSAKYLIEKFGARTIALEAPADSVAVLNRALTDPNAPIQDIPLAFPYITWTTPELIELFRWIQGWNSQNPSSLVDVVGIDPKLRVDPGRLQKAFGSSEAFDLYKEAFAEFREADEKFRQVFESCRVEKKPLPDWQDFRNFEQSIKALRKYVTQEGTPCRGLFECAIDALEWMQNPSVVHREEVMAQALTRMVKSRGTQDSPVVLLAHSTHIGRLPKMLGALLADEYKEGYKAFCSTSYGGTVTCDESNSRKEKKSFSLQTPPANAFETIFGSSENSVFVDVSALPKAQLEVLQHPVSIRINQGGGTRVPNDFFQVTPATFCDGVFVHKEGRGVLVPTREEFEKAGKNVQIWLNKL